MKFLWIAETQALLSATVFSAALVEGLRRKWFPKALSLPFIASCVLASYVQLRIKAGGACHSRSNLAGKVVVVTGANTGIGFETAKVLAGLGAEVVFACRCEPKARIAMSKVRRCYSKSALNFVELDLSNPRSVREAAAYLTKQYKQIDILVNNAGVMDMMGTANRDVAGHEYHLGANVFGAILLTELLLPHIKSAHGRIVNLGSIAHWAPQETLFKHLLMTSPTPVVEALKLLEKDELKSLPGYRRSAPYGLSKGALMLYAMDLAERVKGTGVRVVSLHPGCVATELVRNSFISFILRTAGQFLFKTSLEGAQTTLHCCLSADVVSGHHYIDCRKRDDCVRSELTSAEAKSLYAWVKEYLGLPQHG